MPKASRAIDDGLFDKAYAQLWKAIDKKKVSTTDVMQFAVLGMQIVEQYPQLTGSDKKQLVIRLAHKVVADLDGIEDEDRANYQLAIDLLLPSAIDLIVSASKGAYQLGEQLTAKCFAKCKK